MAREGTRSQTGHAAPRVFQTVDTAPAITRKKSTKAKPAPKPAAAAKPTGVTKKKVAKKEGGAAAKVRCETDPGVVVIGSVNFADTRPTIGQSEHQEGCKEGGGKDGDSQGMFMSVSATVKTRDVYFISLQGCRADKHLRNPAQGSSQEGRARCCFMNAEAVKAERMLSAVAHPGLIH